MNETKYDVLMTESQLGLMLTALEEYSAIRNGDFTIFVEDMAKEGRDVEEMTEFEKEEYITRRDEYDIRMSLAVKSVFGTINTFKSFLQRLADEMTGMVRYYFFCNSKIEGKKFARLPVSYTKQPFIEIVERRKGFLPDEGMEYFTPTWTKDSFYVKKQVWTDSMDDRMRYKLGLVYPLLEDCDQNLLIDVERVTGRKYIQRKVIIDGKKVKPERKKHD